MLSAGGKTPLNKSLNLIVWDLSLSFKIRTLSFQFSFRVSLSLKKMAFERKRFCFNLNCKVTEDEYKDESNFIKGTYEWYLSKGEKTKFNICSNCVIADFCSKTCQEQAQFLIWRFSDYILCLIHIYQFWCICRSRFWP